MLTNKAKYALRAMIEIAARGDNDGQPVLISEVAESQHIPRRFLEGIMLELRNEGLVSSFRGKTGGYILARAARDISFADIIRVIDGPLALAPCASRTAYDRCDDCKDEAVCTLRRTLIKTRDAVAGVLEQTKLADAATPLRRRRKIKPA